MRVLRWRLGKWSAPEDRTFHDGLFARQTHDPFSASYPGGLTVRRFADHAERSLANCRLVVDLGCGPGEITCELARRHPDIAFRGIDHSQAAIDRARENAARLQLTNIAFDRQEVEQFRPSTPIDLIMMFDAFHHLMDPAGFVQRLRAETTKFFLIEPAGGWTGAWDRRGDLDWLPETLWQIGSRLEYQLGEAPASRPVPAAPDVSDGAAVEHRYSLSDFERFFGGFALDVRGTIAGLERYGPNPDRENAVRAGIGNVVYDLVSRLEDLLFELDMDLGAKHWAIAATRDETNPGSRRRRGASAFATGAPPRSALPAYAATFGECLAPKVVAANETFTVEVQATNSGWLPWNSQATPPVLLSYHWLDGQGTVVVRDGLRTSFPRTVEPGAAVSVTAAVQAPSTAGPFTLQVDIVHENTTWFSEQGVTLPHVKIRVQ